MAERKPPKHLRAAGRAYWRAVLRTYALEEHHIAILTTACDALDRAAQAREVVERVGIIVAPRTGAMVRRNPAVRVERMLNWCF